MSNATEQYGHLAKGGKVTLSLTQEEACAALKVYDDGLLALSNDDGKAFNSLIAKLKDQIWA